MKLIDMTVINFANEVDSNSPAPGGGSVAALASDIGIGLSRMMAHLSFGKKKFEALDEEIKNEFSERFEKLGEIRAQLDTLIDKDTESFNAFMKALKMPKETFKEKIQRKEALEEATKFSIEVPYKTATLSLEAMKQLELLIANGNQNAITDIGVGTLMLCTGLEGAILNVKVNLMGLENKELYTAYSEGCVSMLAEGKEIRDRLLDKVHKAIES
ncbi:MAG: cyclodeaminase/cyclohydrolase family protein [Terrisporobacter sp.]|uniref:cyclodeaminase/cyclohydrolase family protein n=1 Tax=Terrisporobacter sp. TaxID=1965305 RepID=UPI002FCB9DC4